MKTQNDKFKSQHIDIPGVGNPINRVRDDKSPHWFISYSPSLADYGTITTALVLGQSEYMLILCGDHRKEFNEILDSPMDMKTLKYKLELCLDYIRENKNLLHKYSNPIF